MNVRFTLTAMLAVLAVACGARPDGKPAGTDSPETTSAKFESVDRSKLPTAGPSKIWAPPAIERWKTSNGVDVWFLRQAQAPLISLKLILPRGGATDPPGKAGLAALMVDLLDEGAGGRDAIELDEALQRLATDYGASATTDGLVLSMDLLADQLDASLTLLADIVMRPALPAEEFERRKRQRIGQALQAEANPTSGRTVVMRRALFGDGYGAFSPNGTRATLEALTLEDVKTTYGQLMVPTGASFVVVGAIQRAEVEATLDRHFAKWEGTTDAAAQTIEPRPGARGIYFIDYPGSTQSAIALARRAPGFDAPDYFPSMVFNWVLGGAFTSRINLNLREDKGYTYGARSGFNRWRDAGFFWIGAQVKSETTRASVDEIIGELNAVRGDRPLSGDEHRKAIDGLLLGYPASFERLSGVAGQLSMLPQYGLPVDWFTAWPTRVRAVNLSAADAAARLHTDPSDFIIVIAGDRASLAPTLESLDLPILDYDAQGNPVEMSKTATR